MNAANLVIMVMPEGGPLPTANLAPAKDHSLLTSQEEPALWTLMADRLVTPVPLVTRDVSVKGVLQAMWGILPKESPVEWTLAQAVDVMHVEVFLPSVMSGGIATASPTWRVQTAAAAEPITST